jgi:hypothetical protein
LYILTKLLNGIIICLVFIHLLSSSNIFKFTWKTSESSKIKNIEKEYYNQIKRFINSALKRHIDYIDKAHTELYHLIEIIGKHGKDLDRINVYFLLNGFSSHEKEKIDINDSSHIATRGQLSTYTQLDYLKSLPSPHGQR